MSSILSGGKGADASGSAAGSSEHRGLLPEMRTGLNDFVETVRAMPRPAFWWRYRIAQTWRNRRFRQIGLVVVVLLFAASFRLELSGLTTRTFESLKEPAAVYFQTLQQPVQERAAFFIRDEFAKGLKRWSGAGAALSPGGYLHVDGFALHNATMKLHDYRLDFDFRIDSGMLGWAVRATDAKNYYGFELRRDNARDNSGYHLSRYLLSNGERVASSLAEHPLGPAKNGLNHISVQVNGGTIQTLFNRYGVDLWQEDRYTQGGVGFFGGSQDAAFVRRVAVRGNEDGLGLFLYGTIETMRSVREFLAAPLAFTLKPVPSGPAF